MKKSIDLQVFIKYNEYKKALPSSLPLTDILRGREKCFGKTSLLIKRGGTDFVRAEMYSSAQQQKSEVGRLKSAERIEDYETF